MSKFSGAFTLYGGLSLRLVAPADEDFLVQLFIDVRPWLSWVEGGRDFMK